MKKVLAAGGIVLNEKNEILLIYRYSKWDLPKGHVEKDEKFEDCAVREVQEETGIKNIALKKFVGTTEHEYFDKYLHEEVVKETHWFEMSADKDEPLQPLLIEDIEMVKWVPKNELRTYLENSYKNITEIIQRAGFISF